MRKQQSHHREPLEGGSSLGLFGPFMMTLTYHVTFVDGRAVPAISLEPFSKKFRGKKLITRQYCDGIGQNHIANFQTTVKIQEQKKRLVRKLI